MERIVLEVSNETARKWRISSQKRKERITQEIDLKLAKELSDSQEEFLEFLTNMRKTMKERGLTEEILQEILNDD
ncbi:MAG: hypothetical protein QM564_10090 [Bergeyella sp.]